MLREFYCVLYFILLNQVVNQYLRGNYATDENLELVRFGRVLNSDHINLNSWDQRNTVVEPRTIKINDLLNGNGEGRQTIGSSEISTTISEISKRMEIPPTLTSQPALDAIAEPKIKSPDLFIHEISRFVHTGKNKLCSYINF